MMDERNIMDHRDLMEERNRSCGGEASNGGKYSYDAGASGNGGHPYSHRMPDDERYPYGTRASYGRNVSTERLDRFITTEAIEAYLTWMIEEERAWNTIEKYRRDLKNLCQWLDGRPLTKVLATGWKAHLQESGYAAASINSMLAAANGFFEWMDWYEIKIKYLKIQRKVFCDASKELSKEEYDTMVAAARSLKNERLAMVMETLCSAGLRVSELKFVTVESARAGKVEVMMKGKVRSVMFLKSLSKKLLKYAKEQNIRSGAIFITRSGKSMSRSQIWREMKKLCEKAGVDKEKIFPHNLRHLFARSFYDAYNDISKLADMLGHSSLETTRIYLISTGEEHVHQLESLGLVS